MPLHEVVYGMYHKVGKRGKGRQGAWGTEQQARGSKHRPFGSASHLSSRQRVPGHQVWQAQSHVPSVHGWGFLEHPPIAPLSPHFTTGLYNKAFQMHLHLKTDPSWGMSAA